MKNLWLPVFFFLALMPFVKRPWLFDDPSFVAAAQAAAQHPLTPHSYTLDLEGGESPAWIPGQTPAATNPPLDAWVLGSVIRIFGDGEMALHGLMFFVAAFSLLIVSALAGSFTKRRTAAAGILAASPVFFLTSLTLYPHLFYFLFYAATLYSVLRACETGQWRWGILGGLSLTLAALSLYQWPLLAALSGIVYALRGRKNPASAKVLALGLLLFGMLYGTWETWEYTRYGMLHLWASYQARVSGSYHWQTAVLPMVFLGGAFPAVGIAWFFLWRSFQKIVAGLMAAGVAAALLLCSSWGGFSWHQAGFLALFLTSSLAFLIFLVPFFRNGNPPDRLLVVWFLIEFIFVLKYLGYPGAHALLPLCLPAALLVVRASETLPISGRWWRVGFGVMGALTLALAQADQSEAKIGPQLARDSAPLMRAAQVYYWGNAFSGFSYYLKKAGARSWGPQTALRTGDVVILPKNLNTQGPPIALLNLRLERIGVLQYTQINPFRTFSVRDAAGWYSASWGPLPYSLSSEPVEQFLLLTKGLGNISPA